MKYGDTGPLVLQMQRDLISLGYALPKYRDDGELGDETLDAVWRFARDRGLPRPIIAADVDAKLASAITAAGAEHRQHVGDGKRVLLVDLFAGDGRGPEDVRKLATAGAPWHGLMVKATEGLNYHGDPWLPKVWRVAHGLDDPRIAARLGVDWWVTAYHYFLAHQDPVAQAHAYLREIERAGGWFAGTIYPCIDVEEGDQAHVTAQQVIDGVTQWAQIVERATGRPVVLYGGHWIRELGIRNRMGCKYVWPARYTPTLPPATYTDMGFDLPSLFGWQYNGDGLGYLAGYEQLTPLGPEDISVVTVNGGGDGALEHLRSQSWPVVTT